ncbi:MAG: RNA-binding transcriptional accessory protein, partial [Deltaproteobacteria bacterium]|nr:RNA-binding transcriptional accessory protein [Deltaproteobacteria bacterium]
MEPIMIISRETGLAPKRVAAAMQLLDAGATIPFIARYRKEMTDSLDEVELATIRNRLAALTELSERKQGILKSLRERDLLNPELEKRITEALDKPELEDLYEKYRPKKRTRAQAARENGLAPLALFLLRREESDPLNEARKYLSGSRGNVGSAEEALAGARDIIAEQINEDEKVRAGLRRLFQRQAVITADVIPGKEESGCKFKDYFSWRENAAGVAAHRLLAMFRGRDEGVLKVRILPDEDSALRLMEKNYLKNRGPAAAEIERAIKDAWKRLLSRSLENEFAGELKKRADTTAIAIFAKNLRLLLLSPPLGRKRVLALDPGFRSGCKVVCLDEQGKLLQHDLIFLHQEDKAAATLKKLVKKYQIEALAIGNGTAGRETETFVRNLKFEENPVIVMVDESGASIYSASE